MSPPLPQSNGRRDELSPAAKRPSSLGLDPLTDPTPSASHLVSLERVLAPLPQVGAGKDMPSHPPVRPTFSGTFRGLDLTPLPDEPPRPTPEPARVEAWSRDTPLDEEMAPVEVAPEAAAALDAIEARLTSGTAESAALVQPDQHGRMVTILCWSIIAFTLTFVSFILFAPDSWQRAVGNLFR
jgi:hypothetical protein